MQRRVTSIRTRWPQIRCSWEIPSYGYPIRTMVSCLSLHVFTNKFPYTMTQFIRATLPIFTYHKGGNIWWICKLSMPFWICPLTLDSNLSLVVIPGFYIERRGDYMRVTAKIIEKDIKTTNGVVYTIDRVLYENSEEAYRAIPVSKASPIQSLSMMTVLPTLIFILFSLTQW